MPQEIAPGKWELFRDEFITGERDNGKQATISGPIVLTTFSYPDINTVVVKHYGGSLLFKAKNFPSIVQKLQ